MAFFAVLRQFSFVFGTLIRQKLYRSSRWRLQWQRGQYFFLLPKRTYADTYIQLQMYPYFFFRSAMIIVQESARSTHYMDKSSVV